MAEIRSTSQIASKWATVTPQRSPDFEAGVRQPKKDWQTETSNANDAWKGGVQAAIQKDRFKKGVDASSTSVWQAQTLAKGVQRWGPGVAQAADRYERGFAPFRDAIQNTTLPPRFARRDVRNLERVKAITEALGRVKEQLGG